MNSFEIDHNTLSILRKVDKAASIKSGSARLVGGCVRDMLQGIEPDDIDIATDVKPTDICSSLAALGYNVIPTGLKHGTITAIINKQAVEITSLRKDIITDGRHAEIEFTTDWEVDASRRDFTFNAMYMDKEGVLYDYFDGLNDLNNEVIKFVGYADSRIKEDYLRILRYFRFASKLNNPVIDPITLEIITKLSSNLSEISGERIWSELIKICSGTSALTVLKIMEYHNILYSIDASLYLSPDCIAKIEELAINDRAKSPLYYIVAMLNSLDNLINLRKRLKFDSNSYDIMKFIIKNHIVEDGAKGHAIYWVDGPEYVMSRIARGELDPGKLYHYSVYIGDHKLARFLDEYMAMPKPKFPVSGKDLIELGIPPGPDVGIKLKELRTEWGNSRFVLNREELLDGIGKTCV